MLKEKQAGLPPRREQPSAAPVNVINLMDALKRSIAGERVGPSLGRASPKSRKRTENQREMLLPLPGKKKPAPVKSSVKTTGRQKKTG